MSDIDSVLFAHEAFYHAFASHDFSAMADIPYNEREAALLPRQIDELNPRSAFAVHLGDITGLGGACDESIYSWMAGVLAEAAMPVFVLPGDNEWNDCEDPAAAWKLWMKHLLRFEDRWTHDLEVTRQLRYPQRIIPADTFHQSRFTDDSIQGATVQEMPAKSLSQQMTDRTFSRATGTVNRNDRKLAHGLINQR